MDMKTAVIKEHGMYKLPTCTMMSPNWDVSQTDEAILFLRKYYTGKCIAGHVKKIYAIKMN